MGEASFFKDGGKVVKTGEEPKKRKKKQSIQIRGFGKREIMPKPIPAGKKRKRFKKTKKSSTTSCEKNGLQKRKKG